MKHAWRPLLFVGLLLPSIAFAQADPKATARSLIDEGNELYKKGDYRAALARYESAYETYASPKIFFNLAKTHAKLEQPVEAAEAYERFINTAGVEEGSKLHQSATTALAELDQGLGRIAVKSSVLGSEAFIDGTSIGQLPLAPKRVRPGRHELVVQRAGYAPFQGEVEVAAGATQDVVANLLPLAPVVTQAPPPPVADTEPLATSTERSGSTSVWKSPWLWVGIGALVVIGAGTGILVATSGGGDPAELGQSSWTEWDQL